jgi:sigma-54 dependent transcriptional regulator, acetoin dehydrogenase operon transcriptional activator AcoR
MLGHRASRGSVSVAGMAGLVAIEAARRSFLGSGHCLGEQSDVRAEVLASWQRSRQHDVDPDRLAVRFAGHPASPSLASACAEEVFDDFFKLNADAEASLILADTAGVVRARRDGDDSLAALLDGVLMVPGYDYSERAVGTTAASVALHERADIVLGGPEHYHSRLTFLTGAASLVPDPRRETTCGAVVVAGYHPTPLLLPLARTLAQRVADRMADEPHRRSRVILDLFSRYAERDGEWVLATDGGWVVSNAAARRLEPGDLRSLSDLVLGVTEFASKHVDLPSGGCAEIATEGVYLSGELIGCVLTGGPASTRGPGGPGEPGEPGGPGGPGGPPEAVRRQGSHVAPTVRRDYAEDLRRSASMRKIHAEARIRANQDLMTPVLRARQEVAASIRQGRHHLLIGEPGVGKRTLAQAQFRQAFPQGRVVAVNCAGFEAGSGTAREDPVTSLLHSRHDQPRLLLLSGTEGLTPLGARRLDESLRPLVALPSPPLVIACLDTPAVDATRPYGLLLRHFHQITRVPALRYRNDEIGDIALSILRELAVRRSLRLSLQVIRVLEGYAWPGNISELQDVLRYVVARKPVGEIQPPDLPRLCFQREPHKLSMLEAAQCDAIIHALYEARGNRYKAAAMLGIARSSLYRKIDGFGISYIA